MCVGADSVIGGRIDWNSYLKGPSITLIGLRASPE